MLKQPPDQDKRMQSRSHARRLGKRGLYLAAALLLMGFIFWVAGRQGKVMEDLALVDGHLVNVRLLTLPANRWVRIAPKLPDFIQKIPFTAVQNLVPLPSQDWSRQSHAGLAFDSKRGTLLIFASD